MQQVYNYLLILFCLSTYYSTRACSCNSFYNYCDSYESDQQTVSLGIVDTLFEVEYNQVMHFRIQDEVRGSLDTSMVSIFSNGGVCGEDLFRFNIGDTLVLRLMPNFGYPEYATHFLGGLCTTNFIAYSNGTLRMENDSRLRRVAYDDFKAKEGDCSQLTSTEEISTSDDVGLWPNPATDELYLDGEHERYQVVSTDGQLVAEGAVTAQGTVDISALRPGIYTVLLYDNEKRRAGRFVKVDH